MRIRREQGLLLVVAVLGLWIWSSASPERISGRVQPSAKDYEPAPLPRDSLAAEVAEPPKPARDPFLEPSESAPLPPRPLDFPEMGALPVVALPQSPGQHPAAYWQLRVPGEVAPFQFGTEVENGSGHEPEDDAGVAAEPAAAGGGGQEAAPALLFDVIERRDTNQKVPCFIRSPDKYELVGKRGTFTGTIVYDWVSAKDGHVIKPNEQIAGELVASVTLAATVRNRIELRRRALGDGPGSLPSRRVFIEDLLREARGEPWLYPLAEEQAQEYVRIAQGSADGYRVLVSVLRERGDLSGEWKLYQSLPDALHGSAFQLCGMGEIESRLRLDADAEQHLRKAVELDPVEPRCRLSLARFLLDRGRAAEARPEVEAARRNRTTLASAEEEFEVWATLIEAELALGQGDVQSALSNLPTGPQFAARYDRLKAAAAYARREWPAAETLFAAAVAQGGGGEAALGQAACQVLAQNEPAWQAAESSLESIASEYPLQRHRALACLGLLYDRTGNHDRAASTLDSAARVDPTDPYLLYLLGHARRRAGQLDGALEALQAALALADDFVEVHAEMARCYLELADSDADAAESLYRARRHIDRAVDLDQRRGREVRYLELQGIVRFRAADLRAARQAFAAGAEAGSRVCQVGQALVEYARNRVEDARNLLTEMKRGLDTGDPMRDYVTRTIELIDEHSSKEQVRDAFDRSTLGRAWKEQRNGGVAPQLEDGALRIQGKLGQPGKAVFAQRIQPTAGNFLQADVTLQIGAGDDSKDAVLEIATQARRGESAPDFRARLGIRDGRPKLLVEDGDVERAGDDDERKKWDPVDLGVTAEPGAPQRLSLQVAPREGAGRLALLAYWNGELVHQRDIEKLGQKTKTEMAISLLVEGSQSASVDVTFDDFRLVRRKE